MMGGQIWVESRPGEGSDFHFTAQVRVDEAPTSAHPADRVQLTGLRVLVVDNNTTDRRLLGGLLERWGIRPVLATSGAEALPLLLEAAQSSSPFTLLLTDTYMSEMDGWTLVKNIRRHAGLNNLGILMLTSAGETGDAAHCRQLGIAAYLGKPIEPSQLQGAISSVLAARTQPVEPPRLVTRHSLAKIGGACESYWPKTTW